MDNLTKEDFKRFEEGAEHGAEMCHMNGFCPSPLFRACPFRHVSKMPEDCKRTTATHWVALLKALSKIEGTI